MIAEPDSSGVDDARILERHLQKFLAENIATAFGMPLKLMATERVVKDVGRIDMLAGGPRGSVWAIELKIGRATRDAVGQLLSYLGALAAEGIDANGILVALTFDATALAALRLAPNIYCFDYSLAFSLVAAGGRRINHSDFELGLVPLDVEELRKDELSSQLIDDGKGVTSAWPFPQQRDG